MATTIVSNHAVTVPQEKHHLGVPIVRVQRPAMMEDERPARSPILVVNLSAILYRQFVHDFLL